MEIAPFLHPAASAVVFGAGSAARAGSQGPLKRAQRVAVITDRGVRVAGLLEGPLASLGARAVLIDDGVVPDADVRHVDDLAGRARELGVDGLLAVGGGSVMDTAKGVAAVLAKGKRLAELEGMATIRTTVAPLVCVPTTAGTGSEATQFAVIKDHLEGRKRVLMDSALLPACAFLDPTLLVGLPRGITAATGVDAVSHALEALASRLHNPIASALAVEALRRLLGDDAALAKSLRAPDDVGARGACLLAANLAGQAISAAMLGACHAFGHALGAHKGVPHGVANGVFLLAVLRENLAEARPLYAEAAGALGLRDAEALFGLVERTVHEIAGIPRTLGAIGVVDADVEALVQLTLGDADLGTNPVALDEPAVRRMISALR
ncbi:MAG: iron-containing alcohol dehydrogenase [Deltaproteobacteria bacterium]|nr:iron-containing alcohol dehydrogenase [Deltaproteobacteria bacterium]